MKALTATRGDLPEIIRNSENLYQGDLVRYFQVIFTQAQNVNHPYHNFRHMLHVTRLCHQACLFYYTTLTPRQMRNLLIAAMFHDFDHSGMAGNDDLNIARAVRGFEKYILLEDERHAGDIIHLIRATEYPHKPSAERPGILTRIIRDADLAQALDPTWIQNVIFGLAAEWRKTPLEVLRMQFAFHSNLRFQTEWANEQFPRAAIDAKIDEAAALLLILTT